MQTNQPQWKFVGNVGDINPIQYGGGYVYEDTTGVYDPEVVWFDPLGNYDEDDTGTVTVYRFSLERPRFKTLTEEGQRIRYFRDPLPSNEKGKTWVWHNEWFVDELERVASSSGTTKAQLLRLLFSKNTLDRAVAYVDLAQHFGFHEFDHYPLTMNELEAHRYAESR